MNTEPSDEHFMREYQNGEYAAFDHLYRRYAGRTFSYLRKRLNRREDAEEVLQLVFGKLHQSRASYDSAHVFSHWFFVLTKTVLMDFWRKEQTRKADATPDEDLEKAAEFRVVAERSTQAQELDLVAVLEPLSGEQREVVEARVIDELSYAEIARKMSRSEATVRQIFSRALKRLKLSVTGESGRKA